MIPFLIAKVHHIETIVVKSEKEALLLENTLIKQHKPKYNVFLKDDKTYIALKISKGKWPQLAIVRYRGKPKADGQYFGPYTSAYGARQTFDLLNRMFPLRQCSDQEFARRTRPCILYDMKRCLAPCVEKCTKQEYDSLIQKTVSFLRGHDQDVIKELRVEMKELSEGLEFERAGEVWKTIQLLEKTVEKQHVEKPLGGDADVLAIFREGEEVVLCQMLYRGGTLTGSRTFNFSQIAQSDSDLLESFIYQHYGEQEQLPHEILVPEKLSAAQTLSTLLSTGKNRKTEIRTPQKGYKLKVVEIAMANAEASYRQDKDAQAIREKTLSEIQDKLRLSRLPRRIECFDNSNISGSEPVSCLVAFTDGQKDSSRYRKYKIKTAAAQDDYGAMKEVLTRRFKRGKTESDLPDLLIVDGGKGHLNIALKVLHELDIINIDVIGLAKEAGRHDKGITEEQIFLPNVKDPIKLRKTSPILFLFQQIRDEAHRVAITFHRKRRNKKTLKSSLDDIPGIGSVKKKQLLRHFGSLKKMKEASKSELAEVKGISDANVKAVEEFFRLKE